MRRVHHRGHVWPAGLSSRQRRCRDREASSFGHAVSRACASCRGLFIGQSAARDRADPQDRIRRADLSSRRDGENHALLSRRGIDLGRTELVREAKKAQLAGTITLCPPSTLKEVWSRRFPDPVTCFASGWMRVRARARQHLVELPLVISDHADWEGLTGTIAATGADEIWVTHGQEDALVHWSITRGLRARPLDIVGYEDEQDGEDAAPEGDG